MKHVLLRCFGIVLGLTIMSTVFCSSSRSFSFAPMHQMQMTHRPSRRTTLPPAMMPVNVVVEAVKVVYVEVGVVVVVDIVVEVV